MRVARWGNRRGLSALAVISIISVSATSGLAAESCAPLFGRLISIDGRVEVQRAGQQAFQPAALDEALCREDTIRVGTRGRAAIALVNDAVMRLDQDTTLKLLSVSAKLEERSLFDLVLGAIQSFSRRPKRLAVNTPYLNATIEGTEFALRVGPDSSEVTVFEGTVVAANDRGRADVTRGQAAQARAGQAPVVRVVARPRDAVQWALYYPPVLVGGGPAVRRAAESLSAGRVDAARTDIDGAIARNEDAGAAHALRAVIEVVQNDADGALADARRAVELAPKAASSQIALSYALQAKFQLEEARAAMRQAVANEPGNALAWARLAELHLSLGDRSDALVAAEKAVSLAPDTARAQTVLGFVALVFPKTETASAAFEKAIAAASSAPLPRFGLGLAKIRRGDLTEGRKEIEAAVALDSQNALLRAYLGKAYFEEKRGPLDAQQLEIAKGLDPLDPTPYLYDAIRKQTENRPGEALADLQKSIALNDNRAVYRSRQQLDQDRAARGTSLARVYNDLGFSQLGVNEANKSLSLDPSNAAAHRFLSDSFQGVRRRETARVSELLQAQLMQDVNISPLQPSSGAANLNVGRGAGAGQAGFNEFTRLYEGNEVQFSASGAAGNQGTFSQEAVVSGVYDRFSISAGEFRYVTDGFRDNNDIEHKIYDVFVQAAVTPELNVQFEARRRESDQGDLDFNFDPNSFDPTFNRKIDQDMFRAGVRYSPARGHDLLFSFIRNIRDDTFDQADDFFGNPVTIGGGGVSTTSQYEVQHIFKGDSFNLVSGYGHVEGSGTGVVKGILPNGAAIPFPPFVLPPGTVLFTDTNVDQPNHNRYYSYLNVPLPEAVKVTLGVAYDNLDQGPVRVDKWSPKVGVQWDATDRLRFRLAAFQIVKPTIVTNRTIEPTHVAGFNQLFDDARATESRNVGIGVDARVADDVFAGVEGTLRRRAEPVILGGGSSVRNTVAKEGLIRGYVNWKPDPFAVSLEPFFERFITSDTIRGDIPRDLRTWGIPVTVRYFHSSGLFASVGTTYIHQKVERLSTSSLASGTSDFATVDAAVGYRLPNRLGVVSLQVTNLFDRNLKYQDDGFRDFGNDPSTGPYFPDHAILVRAALRW